MSQKFSYILLLFTCLSFSQSITVDDTSYSAEDLVDLLLSSSCTEADEEAYSSGQAVAYFNRNGSTFPLEEGIIIRTGIAKQTEGIYTGTNLSTQLNSNSDPDLEAISVSTGQSATITDTAFLEFEFTPISSNFNFDFVFASNEYGEWQCGFSDVFAFLLTDTVTGTTTNLAIVPSTSDPVTVATIRDNTYNPACSSVNPSLFSTYNVDAPAASTLNMRGHTTVLNASSTLTPDRLYRIRMVIGDILNPDYDSAVFIDTGNFVTAIDLGDNTSLCAGDIMSVTTDLDDTEFTHSWTLDGDPTGGNSNTLIILQPGTYVVTAVRDGCILTDTIIIEDLAYNTPDELFACEDASGGPYSYDLSLNNETTLDIDDGIYDVYYYDDLIDITNNIATHNPITNITNYSPGSTIIYIKIFNTLTNIFCTAILEFDLSLSAATVATEPDDIQLCNTSDPVSTDLTAQDSQILDILDPLNYTVSYFESEQDAINNVNPVGPNYDVSIGNSPVTVWALLQSVANPSCFDTTSFQVIVNPLPPVTSYDDVIECSEYTLPPIPDVDGDGIPDGIYYDAPGGNIPVGTANMLNAGDVIDETGTYYIYNGPDANGCSNESSFEIDLIYEYSVDIHHCEVFSVPLLPPGEFYTGPNGTGAIIDPTTVYNNTTEPLPQPIYYYAEITDPVTGDVTVCRDEEFIINIYDLPLVDELDDVVECFSHTLEPLTNGAYYDAPGGPLGTGNLLNSGDSITTSGIYYVYSSEEHEFINGDGEDDSILCEDEWDFTIDIINIPIVDTQCGSYTLPPLEVGEYYLASDGQGDIIPQESVFEFNEQGVLVNLAAGLEFTTNSIEIFIYAETSSTPNCTSNLSFILTINPNPEVDTLTDDDDFLRCIDDPYVLPALTNGAYFTESGGTNDPLLPVLVAGSIINTSQTIYIYNQDLVTLCDSETSFEVEIRELPLVDNYTDVYTCDPYELPELTNGTYFTESGGTNDPTLPILQAGSEIEETQTIYIYNAWSDLTTCITENVFVVNIEGVDVGPDQEINACDSFTLPPLTAGNYYTDQNGVGLIDPADPSNYIYNIPDEYTIYIYLENGDRITCQDEAEITLTISETPVLPFFANIEECGSYDLPTLDNTVFTQNYYTEPGGVGQITDLELTTIGEQTIYVYATATNNTECFDETSFTVTIHPLLELDIEGGIICVDPVTGETIQTVELESNLSPNEYTVEWFFNGASMFIGPNYEADQAGTYTVVTTMLGLENPPNCNYTPVDVEVEQSSTAILADPPYTITDDFEDNAIVTVNLTGGFGQYQYQLDDGPFQDSNQFSNVSSGDQIIYIMDVYGNCGIIPLEVTVIKYPKFFTPNNDGTNDRWNIWDLSSQPDAVITIFDRYGKFITQLSPAGNGWDGTYNGANLFASDYWFIVTYKGKNDETKEFKAHFSLKR